MLEHLQGTPVTPDNFTLEVGKNSLKAPADIHSLGIVHNDIFDFHGPIKNVMLLNDGEVKWIDFEQSRLNVDVNERSRRQECNIAKRYLGEQGIMHKFL